MNTSLGYSKRTLDNTKVLLSGGGDKLLSDFIGSISWDADSKELKYTPIGGNEAVLVTLGSNALNSTAYLPLSGGTLSNSNFGSQLIIERSGSANMAAIGFKNSSGILGYLATDTVNGAFVRYNAAASASYTILDSSNSSVSKSGETLTVKINGTSQSLTNSTYTLAGLMGSSVKGSTTQPIYWNGSGFTNCTAYGDASVNYASYSGYSNKVLGSYTANGGKQNPDYFGKNRVGFLMMNTAVNGNSQYKDWVIMDCYSGNDVGGGVAIGVNRQSLGAYIMRSAAERTSWAESAELCGTHNSSVSLSGSTLTVKIAGVEKSLTNTWNAMTGATSSANGTVGYVNAVPPKDGYNTKFLRADGTWSVPALSGGTLTGALTIDPSNTSSFQDGIILNDKGGGASEALTIKWTSASYTTGVKLTANLASNSLIFHNGTDWYTIYHSGNNPFVIRGELSDAYINGTTYSTLDNGTYLHTYTGASEAIIHFQRNNCSASGLDIRFKYPQDSSNPLQYRKCIDSNRFASTNWVTLIDSLNISSQSVSYATSAGSATTAGNVTGTVAIANGGTGKTTAAGARANLGTWALISDSYDTLIKADGSTNGWIKIGTSNSSYGLLPSTSGGAGSGHNYIGTSSWYWGNAYIDNINGYLYGTGATLTGVLNLKANAYSGPTGDYAMNCNNSDIIGVNSIYTSDLSDNWQEGIEFKRTDGNWDSLRAADSTFYFNCNNGGAYATLYGGEWRGDSTIGGNWSMWQKAVNSSSHSAFYAAHSSGYGIWVGTSTSTSGYYLANFCAATTGAGSGGTSRFMVRADGRVIVGSGLLDVVCNSRKVTIGAQNNEGIHIYNDNNCGFYFNGPIACNSSGSYGLGTSSYHWGTSYIDTIVLSKSTSATMTGASTNPKITFTEFGTQQVHLIYTDYDSYRAPAGLKVVGDGSTSSSSPAWFEAEGNMYASNFYITSDRSKKQNISSFSEHIRKFQLKETGKWHYGVIALEVPEIFRDGEEGNMTVNYTSILSYYVGQLENKVASLEKELSILKQKLK